MLIVDDDPVLLRALERMLDGLGASVRAASAVREALAAIEADHFDVVISDYRMPDGSGIEVLIRARHRHPNARRILMTGALDDHAAAGAINEAAVHGYIPKPIDIAQVHDLLRCDVDREIGSDNGAGSSTRLEAAIHRLQAAGQGPIPPDDELAPLSTREREIALAVAKGASTDEIAMEKFISPHTVRNHLKSIFRKLGVHSRADLLRRMVGMGSYRAG